jgi:hypothetical protein
MMLRRDITGIAVYLRGAATVGYRPTPATQGADIGDHAANDHRNSACPWSSIAAVHYHLF